MNQFFTQLAETLKDRQELRMNIKKIDGDLVIVVTPNFKEEGKTIQMSGTPEEMDEHFINDIQKPLSVEKAFESNADEVKKELEEEVEEEEKEEATKAAKKADKKSPAKKGKEVKKPVKEKEVQEKKESKESTTEDKTSNEESAPETETVQEDKKPEPSAKEQFKHLMEEGKRLFNDRQYAQAESAYKSATELFPEDDKAKAALTNATKWVKAIENMNKDKKQEGE